MLFFLPAKKNIVASCEGMEYQKCTCFSWFKKVSYVMDGNVPEVFPKLKRNPQFCRSHFLEKSNR
jgi:hypothetical protein